MRNELCTMSFTRRPRARTIPSGQPQTSWLGSDAACRPGLPGRDLDAIASVGLLLLMLLTTFPGPWPLVLVSTIHDRAATSDRGPRVPGSTGSSEVVGWSDPASQVVLRARARWIQSRCETGARTGSRQEKGTGRETAVQSRLLLGGGGGGVTGWPFSRAFFGHGCDFEGETESRCERNSSEFRPK